MKKTKNKNIEKSRDIMNVTRSFLPDILYR